MGQFVSGKISIRYDSGCFDFELRFVFDQRADLHERHGGEVLAYDAAIGFAQFAQPRQIFLLVEHKPGQPRDMAGLAAGFLDERDDIGERLTSLGDEIDALEPLLGVPADLAGEKHRAPFCDDAIAETLGCSPAARMKKRVHVHHRSPPYVAVWRSRKRWILPVWVFGSASMNLTERGYLNGAMVALTWSCRRLAHSALGAIPSLSTTWA